MYKINWAAQHADAPLGTHLWVVASIFMASVAIAYASVKVYDILLQQCLSDRFLHKQNRPAHSR